MRSPINAIPQPAVQSLHSVAAFHGGVTIADANLPFIYLPISAVKAAVGFGTAHIYALIKVGEFPAGDLIGAQSRRWKSTDIGAWLNEQASKAAEREEKLGGALRAKADKAIAKAVANRASGKAGVQP